jgi:hypothetical protein
MVSKYLNHHLITKRVIVEASETSQSSFDHELGASRHHKKEVRKGNVGAAGNDTKFLTSS